MMTSKADMRSVATNSRLSPKSKISRTLPLFNLRMPGKFRERSVLFDMEEIMEDGRGGASFSSLKLLKISSKRQPPGSREDPSTKHQRVPDRREFCCLVLLWSLV